MGSMSGDPNENVWLDWLKTESKSTYGINIPLSYSARHLRDGETAHGIRLPSLIFSDG